MRNRTTTPSLPGAVTAPAVWRCAGWDVTDPGGDLLCAAGEVIAATDPGLREMLERFRVGGRGALLLDGLPIGRVGATPASPTAPADKDRTSELVLTTVAFLLGQPVGYLPEHGGDLVQNILPVASAAARQISTSSKVELMFHTEAAFHPHLPRFLLLLCLRGDPAAATTLAVLDDIVARLDPTDLAVLAEPRFRTRADESYVGHRGGRLSRPGPVIGRGDRPWLRFDADLMEATDPEAAAALARLGEAVLAARQAVVLEAGQLLVVDNRTAVHGRSPFTPRFDGTDRWLQRAFVVEDLAGIADLDGRIITTRFD